MPIHDVDHASSSCRLMKRTNSKPIVDRAMRQRPLRSLPFGHQSWRKLFYAYILPIRYLGAIAFCVCPCFLRQKSSKKHKCDKSVSIGVIDQVRSANDDPNALLQINR